MEAVLLQRFAAGPPAATDAPRAIKGLFTAIKATPPAFRGIFSEFQSVASAAGGLPPVKHKTVHHIHTAGPPATGQFPSLDPAKLAAAKAEFSKLEKDRIIQRSSSNWSAPLHMEMKPDRTCRTCSNYRWLNLATTPDLCHECYFLLQSESEPVRRYCIKGWEPVPGTTPGSVLDVQ